MVRVWIKQSDITKVSLGGSPAKYWTVQPNESEILEMNITIKEFSKWQQDTKKENVEFSVGKKQQLND